MAPVDNPPTTAYPYGFFICHDPALQREVVFPLLVLLQYGYGAPIALCEYEALEHASPQATTAALTKATSQCQAGLMIISSHFFVQDPTRMAAEIFNQRNDVPSGQAVLPVFYQLTPDQCSELREMACDPLSVPTPPTLAAQLASVSGYERHGATPDPDFWAAVVADLLLHGFQKYKLSFLAVHQIDMPHNTLVARLARIYRMAQQYRATYGLSLHASSVAHCVEFLKIREIWEATGVIHLPPPHPEHVERSDLLRNLAHQFSDQQPLVTVVNATCSAPSEALQPYTLSLGKTALALAYAHQHYESGRYYGVHWVDAHHPEAVDEGFLQLAHSLGIYTEKRSRKENVQAVYQALSSASAACGPEGTPWLIVLDGAPDPAAVQDYWPDPARLHPGQHVLMTSRSPSWEHTLAVGVFSEAEARMRIDPYGVSSSLTYSETLAHRLGYLPAALDRALRYMRNMNMSVSMYLDLYQIYKDPFLTESLGTDALSHSIPLPQPFSAPALPPTRMDPPRLALLPEKKAGNPVITSYRYGFFISHRGTRKGDVAFPLLAMLRDTCGPNIAFYDQVDMPIAGKGEESIQQGVEQSRVGLILLCRDFFKSDYTTQEAELFLKRHQATGDALIPVFYELSREACGRLDAALCQEKDGKAPSPENKNITHKQQVAKDIAALAGLCYEKTPREDNTTFWINLAVDIVTHHLAPYGLSVLPACQQDYTQPAAREQLRQQFTRIYAQAQIYHAQYPKLNAGQGERFFEKVQAQRHFREAQITHFPQRHSAFFGREGLLTDLWTHLSRPPQAGEHVASSYPEVTLYGIGGVGKTQLAVEFAHRHYERGAYQLVRWIAAEDDSLLRTAFLEAAQKSGLRTEELPVPVVVRWLYQQWADWDWLLVFDNAQDAATLQPYLPRLLASPTQKRQHILITSRNHQWKDPWSVEAFSPSEARQWVQHALRLSTPPEPLCDQLADALGGLPLALTQALAYIQQENLSLDAYLEQYRAVGVKLLGKTRLAREAHTVLNTYHVSMQTVFHHPLARELLLSCAFLYGKELPLLLLTQLPLGVENAIGISKRLAAIQLLRRYSLLTSVQENCFSMHLLLQEVIVEEESSQTLTRALQAPRLEGIMQTVADMLNVEEIEKNTLDFVPYRVHAQHVALHYDRLSALPENRLAPSFTTATKVFASLLHGWGNLQGLLGDAAGQKALLERALAIEEPYYGKDHPQVASILNNLATALGALGDTTGKKALLERALAIAEPYYGKDHPQQVASILANLANAFGDLGDTTRKKALLERALAIEEPYYGKDHPQVATTLLNLANALGALGDAAGKKALLKRALKIKETYYGKDHLQVAITLGSLGNALSDLGDTAGKKALLERALAIEESYYGKDHPQVAITLNNLATTLGALGDAAGKKALLKRALKIKEAQYGKDHPQVAGILDHLANALGALGDAAGQKALLERALKIQETHYGKDHPQVAMILSNLANALGALGDAAGQKALLERALKIQETHYGKDHPQVAITLCNLATAEAQLLEGLLQAEQYMLQAYHIFTKHHIESNRDKAKQMLELIRTFKMQVQSFSQSESLEALWYRWITAFRTCYQHPQARASFLFLQAHVFYQAAAKRQRDAKEARLLIQTQGCLLEVLKLMPQDQAAQTVYADTLEKLANVRQFLTSAR